MDNSVHIYIHLFLALISCGIMAHSVGESSLVHNFKSHQTLDDTREMALDMTTIIQPF